MSTDFRYPQDDTVTASEGLTPSQTIGPFFKFALPYDLGSGVVGPDHPGAFRLYGQVLDGDGQPIPDSMLEIWQADPNGDLVSTPGIYDEPGGDRFRGFGRCGTDEAGRYEFRTVKPGAVPTVDGHPQAPYVAMAVFARGMLRQAVTRVYFDDEAEANAADPLLSSVEEERRRTMIANRVEDGYRFDVRVQGADETVFLDVFAR
ncbi:MAG: protocatechuate 3,4-dioxygenase subunit alpha [Propionibacteriales bacterium]|nr:protocatechuate 3,4-dioxygenase subunit alpha [Propionibacteriales bacterium]